MTTTTTTTLKIEINKRTENFDRTTKVYRLFKGDCDLIAVHKKIQYDVTGYDNSDDGELVLKLNKRAADKVIVLNGLDASLMSHENILAWFNYDSRNQSNNEKEMEVMTTNYNTEVYEGISEYEYISYINDINETPKEEIAAMNIDSVTRTKTYPDNNGLDIEDLIDPEDSPESINMTPEQEAKTYKATPKDIETVLANRAIFEANNNEEGVRACDRVSESWSKGIRAEYKDWAMAHSVSAAKKVINKTKTEARPDYLGTNKDGKSYIAFVNPKLPENEKVGMLWIETDKGSGKYMLNRVVVTNNVISIEPHVLRGLQVTGELSSIKKTIDEGRIAPVVYNKDWALKYGYRTATVPVEGTNDTTKAQDVTHDETHKETHKETSEAAHNKKQDNAPRRNIIKDTIGKLPKIDSEKAADCVQNTLNTGINVASAIAGTALNLATGTVEITAEEVISGGAKLVNSFGSRMIDRINSTLKNGIAQAMGRERA